MTAADVREGGRWSPAQRLKNDVLYALARAALAFAAHLPSSWTPMVGRGIGRAAHRLLPGAREEATRNVARAFPTLSSAEVASLVARTYDTLGGYLGELVAALDPRVALAPLPMDAASLAELRRALAEGNGVVLAAAHLGPWERVATSLLAHGVPLVAVAREAYDPRWNALYERMRGARGVPVIYRGAPGAGTRLVRTLRQGHVLGIPMDLASRVPSVTVPFLDQPAPTPVGPARLALRTGAAVVVATVATVEDGALGLRVSGIPKADLEPGPEGERALTERINRELGARIRALPHGWVWMHPRWKATR